MTEWIGVFSDDACQRGGGKATGEGEPEDLRDLVTTEH